MTLKHMKNKIKRLKRFASINFDEKHFEEAAERHEARLICLIGGYWFREPKEAADKPSPKKVELVDEEFLKKILPGLKKLQQDVVVARALLVEDTPKKWAEDQDFMEQYEYDRVGDLTVFKRRWAYGRSPEEMWEHYIYLVTEPSRRKKERDLERKKERKKLEKRRGKPIRLHPEYGPGRWKYYTPEFKDGSWVWGVSHLYPYSDFPEFSGYSIVELEDCTD